MQKNHKPVELVNEVKKSLLQLADPQKANFYPRFFKTAPGQYGEGDQFIGVTVPNTRLIVKKYKDLDFRELKELIQSPIHEERLCALLILVEQFKNGDTKTQEKIYKFYLANTKYINNWDLVDLSADKIVGAYLENKPKDILFKLSKSQYLWERRIAILATFHDIKKGEANFTLQIVKIIISDKHDLIHKAAGWMLREAGKRCNKKILTDFLDEYSTLMPRTMLRYAIERFPETERQKYLNLKTTYNQHSKARPWRLKVAG